MISFEPSTEKDIPEIDRWAKADPYHKDQNNPQWWLTGNGLLAFVVHDEIGPLFYARIDVVEKRCRLNVQFAPRDIVTRRRLINGLREAFPKLADHVRKEGYGGFLFDSDNPPLIKFMQMFKFTPSEKGGYQLDFER
jgi:hypothetical protein